MRPVRIDAHHHVWDLAVRDQPWTIDLPRLHRSFDYSELVPQLDAAGIDATIVVQTLTVADETPELLELACAHPRVAGVVGWVDLTAPDVADRLSALRRTGGPLVAIRHQVQSEPDPQWLLRADVERGLRAVAEAGLVYDLLVTADQLPAAIEIVRRLPTQRFVLDHGAKPPIASGELSPWSERIRRLAEHPNVAVKLSGLLTEAGPDWSLDALRPHSEVLLDAFGADRVMFGSDWPVSSLCADYAAVVEITERLVASLSHDERDAIFGATARTWYDL